MTQHATSPPSARRSRNVSLAAVLTAAALVIAGCSSGTDSAAVTVTVPAETAPDQSTPVASSPAPVSAEPASSTPPAPVASVPESPLSEPSLSEPPLSPSAIGSAPTPSTAAATTTSVVPSAEPGPAISTVPAAAASGVSPIAPVVVTAASGILIGASLTTPEGRTVKGSMSADKRTWTAVEPLGYNRKYTIDATAEDASGTRVSTATFTTLKPGRTVFPSFFPNAKMKKVGVGQPMVVIFDKAPADRAAAEKTLIVKTTPAVEGAWYWWDDRTVHYRPKEFWEPGTKIAITAKVYGVDFGGGMYGETDRTLNVSIGDAKVAKIDDATKQMKVFINDKLVRTVPVSMGMAKTVTVNGKKIDFITPSGTYVAQERYEVRQMSSATYGLPVGADTGYDKAIPLAVRISNGGVFVHSAPWSVKDQGVRNVSHGCININPEAGRWFYDNFSFGDVVKVTGTATQLKPDDGFGDWNIPWTTWLEGSAL